MLNTLISETIVWNLKIIWTYKNPLREKNKISLRQIGHESCKNRFSFILFLLETQTKPHSSNSVGMSLKTKLYGR